MTGRDNLLAALSAQGAAEIPVVIPYEGIYIRDHWRQLTELPWWHQFAPDIEHQIAWRRDVIDAIGQDWFRIPACAPTQHRREMRIEPSGDHAFVVNSTTGRRDRIDRPRISGWAPMNQVQSIRPEALAQTPAEIAERIPLPEPFDKGSLRATGQADLADRMLAEFGTELCPLQHVITPLWHTYQLWGFEGMMTMVGTRPDLVRYACRRYLRHNIRRARRAASLGAEVIWIEDCLTDMVSPKDYADLNLPFLRPLTDEIRALGMKSIHYYCGDPSDRWDLLLNTGADALSLEEGKKGFSIDIEDVVDHIGGRMTVFGNLDAIGVLQDGTEEQLRAEIARQIAAGRNNNSRFILSLGSPVTPDTPPSRVRLYCDLARDLGTS